MILVKGIKRGLTCGDGDGDDEEDEEDAVPEIPAGGGN